MELKLDFVFFLRLLQNLLEEMHKTVCLCVKSDRVNRLISSNHAFCNHNLLRIAHTFSTLFLLKLSTHITQTICIELVTTLSKHQSN